MRRLTADKAAAVHEGRLVSRQRLSRGSLMEIRAATKSDLPGILAIYNDVIATTTAVYAEQPVTLDNGLAWFRARREQH
jgi:hypothetical protein